MGVAAAVLASATHASSRWAWSLQARKLTTPNARIPVAIVVEISFRTARLLKRLLPLLSRLTERSPGLSAPVGKSRTGLKYVLRVVRVFLDMIA